MENKDWIRYDLDDVVFEYRNQQYGAYFLRKRYGQHIKTASFWGISVFLLLIISPIIADTINSSRHFNIDEKNVLYELPETKKPVPPQQPKPELPKPPPPKKQIATQDFRPPIVKDNPVEEPIIPKIEDIKVAVSNKTQEGEKIDLPPIEVPEIPVSETKFKNDAATKATDNDEDVIIFVQQWKPGKQNGKPVNVAFTLPVKFKLT